MLLRSISLCAALVAPLLAQLPATAAADAAEAYREAWQRFDAEFVVDEGEALFLPDAPLEDDRWIPLLAPSRRSLEAFLAAAAVEPCGFVPAAPGELCELATRLFATTALVRLAGAHALHGRLELLDAARAQLAFSRHVRGFGDAMAATVSTSCELEGLRILEEALQRGADRDDARAVIEHHEARRWSIGQWEPALRERFDRDVEAFVGARKGQHAPLFDAAFHRAWRAEVIGFADAHFGILRDADAPADRIVRRLREHVAEYRADWTALTSGRSPAETLEEVGMSELLGRAAGLENLPNMGAIVVAFSRCEDQLEVCRALVAEGRRDGG